MTSQASAETLRSLAAYLDDEWPGGALGSDDAAVHAEVTRHVAKALTYARAGLLVECHGEVDAAAVAVLGLVTFGGPWWANEVEPRLVALREDLELGEDREAALATAEAVL